MNKEWHEFAKRKQCPKEAEAYVGIDQQMKVNRKLDRKVNRRDLEFIMDNMNSSSLVMLRFQAGRVFIHREGTDAKEFRKLIDESVKEMFQPLAKYLPDMFILLNAWDEPVSLPHHESLTSFPKHPLVTESNRHPYILALLNSPQCQDASRSIKQYRDSHFFFHRERTSIHPDVPIPVMSWTTIRKCYSDIAIPTWHHRQQEPFVDSDLVEWNQKKNVLFWRGANTGSSSDSAYAARYGMRAQFLDYAREYNHMQNKNIDKNDKVVIDAGFTKYEFTSRRETELFRLWYSPASYVPATEQFQNKYLMMLDGWTFNERLYKYLSSGSLLFRANMFDEWYEDLIKPWEHYIPARPDFSDLAEMLQWAVENDDEAKRIAENARKIALRYFNPLFHQCFLFRLLLEYSQIFQIDD